MATSSFSTHSNTSQDQYPRIHAALDFGTARGGISVRVLRSAKDNDRIQIRNIKFTKGLNECDMIAAYIEDQFYFGDALQKLLDRENVAEESIFRLFKLCLYPHSRTSLVARIVADKLKGHGKTFEDLLADCVREMMQCAILDMKPWIINTSVCATEADVKKIPIDLFLSIPRMWGLDGRFAMQKAAIMVGLPQIAQVELVYEPECAAIYILKSTLTDLGENLGDLLDNGTCILTLDVGGGTADACCFRIQEQNSKTERTKLKVIGEPSGYLCGSEFVDLAFVDSLNKIERDDGLTLAEVAVRMGLDVDAYKARAKVPFEKLKQEFPDQERYALTVFGNYGADKETDTIVLSKEQMEGFFVPQVARIHDIISAQIRANPDIELIVVPGGFGRSRYLIESLKNRFQKLEISICPVSGKPRRPPPRRIRIWEMPGGCVNPVAQGALLRYQHFEVQELESSYTIGVALDEEYDEQQHPDVEDVSGDEDDEWYEDISERYNYRKIHADTNVEIVEKRWKTLIPKGVRQSIKNRSSGTLPEVCWEVRFPPAHVTTIFREDIYYTMRDIEDHDPTFKNDGTLAKGIHKLTTVEKEFNPHTFADKPWPVEKNRQGQLVHRVWLRLVGECHGPNLSFGWQIILPGEHPFSPDGRMREGVRATTVWDEASFVKLSSATHSLGVKE